MLQSGRKNRKIMPQLKIPCMLMRGGTSKGPFFDLRDLPSDGEQRNKLLLRLMGSPDVNQIDGLGGAKTVTSKVVMVQPSLRERIDIDFLFAQVEIEKAIVDIGPTCGNMMTGVAPFAIERKMIKPEHPKTKVRIYNINTDSVSEAIVQTPNGIVEYNGKTTIDGVPGTAAGIRMNLFDQHGAKTGSLFPSGKTRELINGVEVSLVDSCTVLMLLKAKDIGLSGDEGKEFFSQSPDMMKKLADMRLEAGKRMGLGNIVDSVLPRIGILSPPKRGGALKSQYFTPYTFHHAHAVSGAICIATAAKVEGTVASDIATVTECLSEEIVVEHVSGKISVHLDLQKGAAGWEAKKASMLRTARKIMDGFVFLPIK